MRSATYRLWGGIAAASALLTLGAAQAAGVDDAPGASTAASNTSLIRDASSMTAGGILAGVSGGSAFGPDLVSIAPSAAGGSADNGRPRFGVWAGGGYLYTKFDNALLPYNGNLYSSLLGFDYAITRSIAVGVAGGYENWNVKTDFDTGTLKTNGYTAAPYLRLALGRYVTLSGLFGYSSLSNDETRTAGTVRGSFDSTRWFGGTMLSGNYRGDNWLFNASFSYIYTDQKDDAYNETGGAGAGAVHGNTAKVAQGQLGLRIGYDIGGSGFVPFMTARLEHEFTHPGNAVVAGDAVVSDATGYILGGGLGYSRGAVSVGIEGDTVKGRSSLTDYQVLGDIRFRF